MDIDQATHQVQKIVMKVGNAEYTFDMTREKVGTRWGVKSLVLTNPQATGSITYEYAEVNGFWLPRNLAGIQGDHRADVRVRVLQLADRNLALVRIGELDVDRLVAPFLLLLPRLLLEGQAAGVPREGEDEMDDERGHDETGGDRECHDRR